MIEGGSWEQVLGKRKILDGQTSHRSEDDVHIGRGSEGPAVISRSQPDLLANVPQLGGKR